MRSILVCMICWTYLAYAGRPGGLLIVVTLECCWRWFLEFESHRGDIVTFFGKIKKDQLLRAPSVGSHSTRIDEGRNGLNPSRDKNERHEPEWGGGTRAGWRGRGKKGQDNKWDEERKKRKENKASRVRSLRFDCGRGWMPLLTTSK